LSAEPSLLWRVQESFRLRVREPWRRRRDEAIEQHGPRAAAALFAAAERAARVTHRHEHNDLPEPIVVDGERIDTTDDLQAFTGLPREVVEDVMTKRRHLSFRAEWLATPEPLRDDHWFYLSSKTYLLNNAVHFRDASFVDTWIAPHVPAGGRVLDFGGGSGELVLRCVARGLHAAHLELNALQRDFMRFRVHRHGLEDRVEVLDSWRELPPGAFDAIAAMDVIEHLPDPPAVLDGAIAALKPGGVLIEDSPFLVTASNPMHHTDFGLDAYLRGKGLEQVDGREGGTRVWRLSG
jgi:SAM-dependent methyltransferase